MTRYAQLANGLHIPAIDPPTPAGPTPLHGHARFLVHDDRGKLRDDTGWQRNTVSPWLQYMLWSLLNPFDSTRDVRFTDGTYYYPSWTDALNYFQSAPSAYYLGGGAATSLPSGANGVPEANPNYLANLTEWLTAGMIVGNYTGSAPAGNQSYIVGSSYSPYSYVENALGARSDNPWGYAKNVLYGPGINASSITGQGPPTPQFTVSRTFAPAAGTVNCTGFIPEFPWDRGGFNTSAFPVAPASESTRTVHYFFAPGTNLPGGVAIASGGFGTGNAVFSTFLLGAAVTVPSGGNLTVQYTVQASL